MAFPPGDGDGRAVGDGGAGDARGARGAGGFGDIDGGRDIGDDETTVLPPVDGDPALVRPYVRAAGSEDPGERDPADATGPEVWAADAEPTAVLPPVPPASPGPTAPAVPAMPAMPAAGAAGAALRRAAAPPQSGTAGKRPGRALALAGGAIALVLIGTGTALLTRPSGSPAVQAAAPSTEAAGGSPAASASASPSPTPSASRSHSAKPSPTPSRRPSPTASRSASPSASPSGSPSPQSTSLSLGSTGPAVSTLQQDLRQLWIDRRNPTGVYDDRTAQDVTTFQTWYNVQGDPAGVYGPNCQAKMAQVLAGKNNGNGNGG